MPRMDLEQIKDKLGIGEDKIYAVMGEFSDPHDLVHAGRKIREMGYTKIDAMSPFPVHGIDEAIGIPHSEAGLDRDLRRPCAEPPRRCCCNGGAARSTIRW